MLTPEYLDRCTDTLLGMYDVLDRILIGDICRALVRNAGLSPSVLHTMSRYEAQGGLMTEMLEHIQQVTGMSKQEIETIYRGAAHECILGNARHIRRKPPGIMSDDMKQVVAAQILKTSGEVQNLTMTTAIQGMQLYIKASTQAEMLVESGAMTYNAAIRRAVLDAAEDGLRVSYPSGHTDHLDVAVRRAVLTGVSQTTGRLTEMYAEENGVEYYEVSAHAGARPTHAEWQGQVYKIHGSDRNYPNFRDATHYGDGDGLCGYNCRHTFFPFVPGVSKRAYTEEKLKEYDEKKIDYNGEKLTEYEASQIMRAKERAIRKEKREQAGLSAAYDAASGAMKAEMKTGLDESNAKLKELKKDYRSFCKAIGRRAQTERTRVIEIEDRGRLVGFRKLAEEGR